MHPQVREPAPGACPICGMALEPILPAAEHGPCPELQDMTRRFWIGGVLTQPLLLWERGAHLPGVETMHLLPAPEDSVDTGVLAQRADALRDDGATVMFLAIDGKPAGLLAVADPIKATTLAAVAALKDDHVRIVMLTGDNRRTAEAVARRLGLDEVEAEVLPADTHAVVKRLHGEGRGVAMESAGATLVKGDLAGIARARALSRATPSSTTRSACRSRPGSSTPYSACS